MGRKIAITGTLAIVLIALVFVYLFEFLFSEPPAVAAVVRGNVAHLTLQTVPSYGHAPDPRLGQLPRQGLERPLAAHDDLQGAGPHARRRSRSTSTTARPACATRSSPRSAGPTAASRRSTARAVTSLNPDLASHTFTVPDLGISVPLPGVADNAKNQCARRAVPAVAGAQHDHLQLQCRRARAPTAGSASCPARSGFLYGNGGPDADDRLDGRRDRGRVSAASAAPPRARAGEPRHGVRIATIWAVATAIVGAADDLGRRAAHPAGSTEPVQTQRPARRQRRADRARDAGAAADLGVLRLRDRGLPPAGRRDRRRAADHRQLPHPDHLAGGHRR